VLALVIFNFGRRAVTRFRPVFFSPPNPVVDSFCSNQLRADSFR
jgi:hypothetical protein